MGKQESYDAFISYRHCSPDSEIAERLHKKLEGFRLPGDVAKKVGRSRLRRVFRDEAELAVSDDLSEEISKALYNSEYLIAICSPEYLKSEWCMRELEFFLQNKDRKHILLVLADGEPETAFPQVLMYEDVVRNNYDGSRTVVRQKSEPLAADCRSNSSKELKANVNKATLRIIAAILGIGYDDLQQRERKAKNKRRTIRTLIAFAVLLSIVALSLFFLIRISRQNEIIKQKYADTLANTSTALLSDGRRRDAIYAARQALPDKRTDNYSENASQALVRALGIYDQPDDLKCGDIIRLPCSASYDFLVSPGGRYASIRGLDYTDYIVDLETEDTVIAIESISYDSVVFDGDRGFVYRRDCENFIYCDLNTMEETDLGFSDAKIVADERGSGYVVISNTDAYFYQGPEQVLSFICDNMIPVPAYRGELYVSYTPDSDKAIIVTIDYDTSSTYAFKADLRNKTITPITPAINSACWNFTSDGSILYQAASDEYGNYTIYAQDVDSSDLITTANVDIDYIYDICINGDDLVILSEDTIYLYDRMLNPVDQIRLSGVVSQSMVTDEGIILLEEYMGVYVIKDGKYDYLYPDTARTTGFVYQQYRNGTLYIVIVGENTISTYSHHYSDYLTTYQDETYISINTPDSEIIYDSEGFTESVADSVVDYEVDRIYQGILCSNADIGLIQLWDGTVYIYDTDSLELLKTIYAMDGYVCLFYYDEDSGYYYISANNVEVYDEDLKKIYEIPYCMLDGFDPETGYPVVIGWRNDTFTTYLVTPITYDEMISLADDILEDYEPDERIREKYSLD